MSAERRYFYLGGDALHSGIYADLLRRLGEEGIRVGLVARIKLSPNPIASWRALRGRDRLGPNSVEELSARIPGGVHLVPMWNLAPALSLPALAHLLRREAPGGPIVLHARQIVMARLSLALRRSRPDLRVIAEFEGDDLAQIDYNQALVPRPSRAQRLRWAMERHYYDTRYRRILRESDAVLCVSENLRDVLIRRYAVPAERAGRMHVMPTFASRRTFRFDPERRERTRREAGLDHRFLVIYSGNLRGAWQVPHKLVEAFTYVKERRADAFFLVLTPDADRHLIEPHLARAGCSPEDCRVQSSPHAGVVDFLCAADVGLLLRDRHPMNEVASPGKFGEYTMSGLPIVMTEGIGDFSAQVRGHEMACVLPGLDDPRVVRDRVQQFCARDFTIQERLEFSRWAGERFAIETVIPRLAALYRDV